MSESDKPTSKVNQEIAHKIKILNELNEELDNYEQFQNELTENIPEFSKLLEEISPFERMDLSWNCAYSTYTLYYGNIYIILYLYG